MSISFHPVKKIEIIVKKHDQQFVQDLLDQSGAKGYTIIKDVAGKGAHGFHEGKMLFNHQSSLIMFMVVADQSTIETVADGLFPLFEKGSGVMFISTAELARLDKSK